MVATLSSQPFIMSDVQSELVHVQAKRYPSGKVFASMQVDAEWAEKTAEALKRSLVIATWLDAARFHAEMWKRGVPPEVARRALDSAGVDDEVSLRDSSLL